MELYLIRHGETAWNVDKKLQGSKNIPLNDKGREQAMAMGERLFSEGHSIEKVYTSPMARAVQTAQIIANRLEVPTVTLGGLQEVSFGKWEGLRVEEIKANYPDTFAAWQKDPIRTRIPGGETYGEVLYRSAQCLKMHLISGEQSLVVSHGVVIMTLRCLYCNGDFSKLTTYAVQNGELITLNREKLHHVLEKHLQTTT